MTAGEEEAGPRAAANGVHGRGLLKSISTYFPHFFPKVFVHQTKMRVMGCQWEKGIIRNIKTSPCPHCLKAVAREAQGWGDKAHSLWWRHSVVIPEGKKEGHPTWHTHRPRRRIYIVYLQPPSLNYDSFLLLKVILTYQRGRLGLIMKKG